MCLNKAASFSLLPPMVPISFSIRTSTEPSISAMTRRICDGKENLRVQGSPRATARGSPTTTGTTTGGGGEVEVSF